MGEAVRFFVPGVPQPGGSKKGFQVRTKSGKTRIAIVEDARHNAPWRAVVALAARDRFLEGPIAGPVEAWFEFYMPRPGSHYGSGKNADRIKVTAPVGHTSKPDVTKLVRSTEDALKGIAWVDDTQVVDQHATKLYANDRRPGCWITIKPFTSPALHLDSHLPLEPRATCSPLCPVGGPCAYWPEECPAAKDPPAQPALTLEETTP